MARINNKLNCYVTEFNQSDYDRIPKSVFAAVAMSRYLNWDIGDKEPVDAFIEEWAALHQNGIVPQKPIALAEKGGA